MFEEVPTLMYVQGCDKDRLNGSILYLQNLDDRVIDKSKIMVTSAGLLNPNASPTEAQIGSSFFEKQVEKYRLDELKNVEVLISNNGYDRLTSFYESRVPLRRALDSGEVKEIVMPIQQLYARSYEDAFVGINGDILDESGVNFKVHPLNHCPTLKERALETLVANCIDFDTRKFKGHRQWQNYVSQDLPSLLTNDWDGNSKSAYRNLILGAKKLL